MNRCENIFTHNPLRDHDGILEVVSLPGHEGHFHVPTQGQFTRLRGITFAEHVALFHLLAFQHNRFQVDAGILVGPAELDQVIRLDIFVERHRIRVLIQNIPNRNLG